MDKPTDHVSEIHSGFNFSSARALFLLIGLTALLGIIYLTQSSQATMTGTRVIELQNELEQLRRSNAQLEYEIAVLTAPKRIAEIAARRGLHPATLTQTTFIVVNNYPVLPPRAAPRNAESVNTASASNALELLWNELMARLGVLSSERTVEASP